MLICDFLYFNTPPPKKEKKLIKDFELEKTKHSKNQRKEFIC